MEYKVMQGLKSFSGDRSEFKIWIDKTLDAIHQVMGRQLEEIVSNIGHLGNNINRSNAEERLKEKMSDDTKWDEVHFSIDAPTPDLHDHLRGQKVRPRLS